jgi:hypothetical protein
LILLSILIPLTFNKVNAQLSPLSITLTVNPLSGQAPFSPSYQSSYSGAYGSVSFVIYWGDGSSNDLTSCGENCPIHTYTVPGTYTITISITDGMGRTASDSQTITVYAAIPQTQYSLQVGAWGDDASIGNTGVGAEIRTHIYSVVSPDLSNSFWVGDNLQGGAFIQFGYELFGSTGSYCLYGHVIGDSTTCLGSYDSIGQRDARWFWQYWPNANVTNFYSGIGPASSAGPDGSWHHYQIWPNVDNGWDFVLDGQPVSSFNDFKVIASTDAVYVAAEEDTGSPSASGTLGPVEFRNLQYWTTYGWNQATSLTSFSACVVSTNSVTNCEATIPYGVTMLGTNDLLAGSGGPITKGGELTLTLNAPSEATVLVDDQYQVSGGGQISLAPGDHLLLASEYVPVSDGVRLRFDHWSDGYPYAGRNIDLNSDTTLEAVYVTQYNLTIISPLPTVGGGWYDAGSTANYSIAVFPITLNSSGLWIFIGWYDQNGSLATIFGGGSIATNAPTSLEARYLQL